ncbi:UTP--glucose-1-phosphate uridylyltransferase [Candidatus Daviesbacteria bacterium RIFCSPLOWO2_02_FULL_38_18]|uniref:UTP--glucose-1-phosphate uridylyltransferase n=1 Tax=Candidatus Daviesbacteria bacterium GW2011_GWF2_38_6 TaxID=1618432 RepID=A0A0G0KF54_9BACT|nr:MAG: Nucleotidyl transferase [Candidatus Daviesbacteria bacterium GW2011_GWA2_38_17]KKQ77472.1 MAG: Nucleotidyl transferase [Candidatus Daviesbacteria bacterium GW2011_GWF2_38_6]OGE27391.1 MAG: UTP--glucose-1-phosphate uridylyltransferase [Candidatus Daviesbacteria bacterium RIFCSPHIGHO2_02_FULL_39_41]OGE45512.1 MAG: UTP--glucose-1-phosphate uridylyltransferase [Candidatus Daviesbacteria bacterium RIFCSPHIGHO2_12_FULL_38_25]OGE68843.1 MAG: UTP--glucose-1-phosphate uridylyltransferase [Candid
MKKITKALIPAAGFGTRFLPQTKAMPKEMLPIVDKPVIQYVVEEIVDSGIDNIIIVTGATKRAIEDHFDEPSEDLVQNLVNGKKSEALAQINRISEMANFIYVRQKGPYGNGTPVLSGEPVIEDEPFAVLWGDEFILSEPPRLKQMIEVHEKYGGMVISGVKIEKKEDLSRYGIADLELVEGNVYKIKKIVEKPNPDEAPSNIATHGAYILPPEIFEALRKAGVGKGEELWLVDGINLLQKEGVPLYAVVIENGKYYDTGNKLEYMKTALELALAHPEVGEELKKYLKALMNKS